MTCCGSRMSVRGHSVSAGNPGPLAETCVLSDCIARTRGVTMSTSHEGAQVNAEQEIRCSQTLDQRRLGQLKAHSNNGDPASQIATAVAIRNDRSTPAVREVHGSVVSALKIARGRRGPRQTMVTLDGAVHGQFRGIRCRLRCSSLRGHREGRL
jgi:hypothetical protein